MVTRMLRTNDTSSLIYEPNRTAHIKSRGLVLFGTNHRNNLNPGVQHSSSVNAEIFLKP
uniref:Uncharacterized protein n=1 Tax=Schistosoma haematobium TaxID=6185 RepID=A0A094ZFI6_SCHHA